MFVISLHMQGGMCQVMFTNPIEIVKIGIGKLGAWQVVKELGFMGLYKVKNSIIESIV